MANVLGELFQNIADAIRSKTGSTDTLKPNQFPAAIEGITTGGGSSADVRYVTFRNESTGEEYKKPVAYGDDCVDVVAKGLWKTPTKESTAQYDYTFYGWGASDGGAADANILKNITSDKTVYAIFTATVRYYTITWLDEDGATVLKTESLAYGTMPSYTPSKNGYIFSGWSPTPTAVSNNASYTAQWIEGVDFASGSWERIAAIAEAGQASQVFSVGDTKDITLSTGDIVTLEIIGFDHDDLADGSGKAGITIATKTLYPGYATGVKWYKYSTKVINWDDSPLRTLISERKAELPSDLQAVIKTVTKKYFKWNKLNSNAGAIQTSDDELWALSAREVGYTKNDPKYDGTRYARFGTNADNASRVKMHEGSAASYYLRSNSSWNENWDCVTEDGIVSGLPYTSSSGLVICFCV